MTKEEKDLLLKDLCGRLPYGVKAEKYTIRMDGEIVPHANIETVTVKDLIAQKDCPGYIIKPYLLPLSSMTEEQKDEFDRLYTYDALIVEPQWELIDFCNKHHLDYRGLIPMGLANDATNLNIY